MWEEVKKRNAEANENESETIFTNVAEAYEVVVGRIQTVISEDCLKEFVEAFWLYDKKYGTHVNSTKLVILITFFFISQAGLGSNS
jgi:hypothetical protein